jgi:hypothetical protein
VNINDLGDVVEVEIKGKAIEISGQKIPLSFRFSRTADACERLVAAEFAQRQQEEARRETQRAEQAQSIDKYH